MAFKIKVIAYAENNTNRKQQESLVWMKSVSEDGENVSTIYSVVAILRGRSYLEEAGKCC